MIRTLLIGCVLLLSACASQLPLPVRTPSLDLPMQLHVQREQDGQHQDWLLVIQREGAAVRWSLMDPLGIPQARQKLVDGDWQADGLLPPNPQARELFAALLFALTPTDEVPGNYPDAREVADVRVLKPHWQIIYQAPQVFTVYLRGQPLNYHVTPLENAP
ncbi:hypothetical protein OOJ96_06440 [Pseudomonas sp. 15FMM2]|uniref:Uncharacterized protein n=1 Tax=Pseudomonas imrae TaxID=2992837 RepID=A0ACC7P9T1_9PSED